MRLQVYTAECGAGSEGGSGHNQLHSCPAPAGPAHQPTNMRTTEAPARRHGVRRAGVGRCAPRGARPPRSRHQPDGHWHRRRAGCCRLEACYAIRSPTMLRARRRQPRLEKRRAAREVTASPFSPPAPGTYYAMQSLAMFRKRLPSASAEQLCHMPYTFDGQLRSCACMCMCMCIHQAGISHQSFRALITAQRHLLSVPPTVA